MGIPPQQSGINVTASDFRGGKRASHLVRAFEQAGTPLADVGIEITESVYLDNHDPVFSREICALREAGIYVALDDFGTAPRGRLDMRPAAPSCAKPELAVKLPQ